MKSCFGSLHSVWTYLKIILLVRWEILLPLYKERFKLTLINSFMLDLTIHFRLLCLSWKNEPDSAIVRPEANLAIASTLIYVAADPIPNHYRLSTRMQRLTSNPYQPLRLYRLPRSMDHMQQSVNLKETLGMHEYLLNRGYSHNHHRSYSHAFGINKCFWDP